MRSYHSLQIVLNPCVSSGTHSMSTTKRVSKDSTAAEIDTLQRWM
jgi:hypothetical protein